MSSNPLNRVAWTEGMFLRPQHLQQNDLYLDSQLNYHLQTLDPYHWGVRELAFNEEAVAGRSIEITALEAVFPSGVIVRYPGQARLEPRKFEPGPARFGVFVGIRLPNPADPNSAPAGNEPRDVRYLLRSEKISELHGGGNPAPVELVFPNLRLFLSTETKDLELYETLKIAEIRATDELARPFAIATDYAPPLRAVQVHKPLREKIEACVAQIREKVRLVSGRTGTGAELKNMWIRYTLSRMSPTLDHLLSTGLTHPFQLYTALVETAGALATFAEDHAVSLPIYDHGDLYGCFDKLIREIDHYLGKDVPDSAKMLPMRFDPVKRFYVTKPKDLTVEFVDPRNTFYLAIKADMEAEQLREWVVQWGKVGAESFIKGFAEMKAVKGLKLEYLALAPTDIEQLPNYQYFKIEIRAGTAVSPLWGKVREEYSLALSLARLEKADVRLYVVLTGTG